MLYAILLALAEELGLPSWTARTLKEAHDEASRAPEDREIQYSIAWSNYHQMLDENDDLSLLSLAYSMKVNMPLFARIDATGAMAF
jgi:hypothetical protein